MAEPVLSDMNLSERHSSCRVGEFGISSQWQQSAQDLRGGPGYGRHGGDPESLVNLGSPGIVDSGNNVFHVVGLASDAGGEDVRVIATADRCECMSALYSGVFQGLTIEANTFHGNATEVGAEFPERLGVLVNYRHRMTHIVKAVSEQRSHTPAPENHHVHGVTLHALDTYSAWVPAPFESSDPTGVPLRIGDEAQVEIANVAHGGHMVARIDGYVIFVRHALPGEVVRVRITYVRPGFARGEAVEVLQAHPSRRNPICPAFVPFGCGGCDFQHADEQLQRDMKLTVLQEALVRLGGEPPERVAELTSSGVSDLGRPFGWRTRMRYDVTSGSGGARVLGMHSSRSSELIDASACTIAHPVLHAAALARVGELSVASELVVAVGSDEEVVVVDRPARAAGRSRRRRPSPEPSRDKAGLHETVSQTLTVQDRRFTFHPPVDAFWQVHPRAMEAIVEAAVAFGNPKPGDTWWDLYAGMGPIAAALAGELGTGGVVHAVEGAALGVEAGRVALANTPQVRFHHRPVEAWLAETDGSGVDGVVLDPPRSGAGRKVIEALARAGPTVIVYIACDPAALARDTAYLREFGYRMDRLRAWDAFPQTHHLEAAAAFVPVDQIS